MDPSLWNARYKHLLALVSQAFNSGIEATSGAAVTIQVGGSAPAAIVQLDSAAFTLPPGMTRVKVDAFMAVQPTTAGEQVEYRLLVDGNPPASGAVETYSQTGTVVGQLSTSGAFHTILTPVDRDPHVYSIQAISAHNLQIGDKTAAIVLTPLA
jgi:hypothetical protein